MGALANGQLETAAIEHFELSALMRNALSFVCAHVFAPKPVSTFGRHAVKKSPEKTPGFSFQLNHRERRRVRSDTTVCLVQLGNCIMVGAIEAEVENVKIYFDACWRN